MRLAPWRLVDAPALTLGQLRVYRLAIVVI
jgi:hypothetical protein